MNNETSSIAKLATFSSDLSSKDRAYFLVRRLLRRCKYFVGSHPSLLPILWRLTPGGLSKAITRNTQLVVEGFPRSGNTFFAESISYFLGPDFSIASHAHHIAQIRLAVARGIPCVVLVRHPVEVLASYLIAGPHARPKDVLREYATYHSQILRLVDEVQVVTFGQAINDFQRTMERVSSRWNLSLVPESFTESDRERILERIDENHRRLFPKDPLERGVARPSRVRTELNVKVRRELSDPEHKEKLDLCVQLFEKLKLEAGEKG